jgi:phenylacetate-CoA ligase
MIARLLRLMLLIFIKPRLLRNYYSISKNIESSSQLEIYQDEKINTLIKHAVNSVQFYAEKWKDLDQLTYNTLPYIDKNEIKQAGPNLISSVYEKRKNHIDYTTGSTGVPFKVVKNIECYGYHYAYYKYAYSYYKLHLGSVWARLWRGSYKKTVKEKLKEIITGRFDVTIYDPQFPTETHLNERRVVEIIEQLNLVRPDVIDGFPSAVSEIAKYICANNIDITFQLQAVVTGAENLLQEQRDVIEQAFGCKVFDRYGGTELGLVAQQCESGFYHVSDKQLKFEVIDADESGVGELVVTDLFNYAMPLIKYRTGDLVKPLSFRKCSCGRSGNLLESVAGRSNDVLILVSGSRVSSHIWHNVVKKYDWLSRYQVIQNQGNEFLFNIEFNHITASKEEVEELKSKVRRILEYPVNLSFEVVTSIKAGVGGKYRQCIRNI